FACCIHSALRTSTWHVWLRQTPHACSGLTMFAARSNSANARTSSRSTATTTRFSQLSRAICLTQRRKGAKKTLRNAAALCVFAPLREIFLLVRHGKEQHRSWLASEVQ